MNDLVTCKNETDSIKNEGAIVVTTFLQLQVYGDFSRRSRAANSAAFGLIWLTSDLIRDVMVVLLSAKMKKIRSKMKVLECS